MQGDIPYNFAVDVQLILAYLGWTILDARRANIHDSLDGLFELPEKHPLLVFFAIEQMRQIHLFWAL